MPLRDEAKSWLTFGSLIDAKLMIYSILARELLKGGSQRRVNDVANRIIAVIKQFPVSAADFNRKYGDIARVGKTMVKGNIYKRRTDVIRMILNQLKRMKRSK